MAPLAILSVLAGGAAAFGASKLLGASKNQAQTVNANPTATPTQTVDNTVNKTNSTANLGRAALILTSPQGVQGTDPVGRYKLLGN